MVSASGSFSPGVNRRVLAFGAIGLAVWGLHKLIPRIGLPIAHYEVAGAVIALVLAFRTNPAYDRFWEGRKLWGSITNASRNLQRIVGAHVATEPEAARDFATWIVLFAHATRHALRGATERPEHARLLSPESFASQATQPKAPIHAAQQISHRLAAFSRAGLDPNMVARAEAQVIVLVDSLGGCERIRGTPTPLGYVLLIQRTVALYLAALPIGLVGELGVLTPIITIMVAYPVLMIEALGRELDDPFGEEPNDLALTRMCETIELDLLGSAPSQSIDQDEPFDT